MNSFGQDFTASPDLRLQLHSGLANLREALIRRLQTRRGGLWYDPTYGTDLREWLNENLTPATLYGLQRSIALELQKDPRVLRADATTIQVATRHVMIRVDVETTEGPFNLILNITDLSVEALRDR